MIKKYIRYMIKIEGTEIKNLRSMERKELCQEIATYIRGLDDYYDILSDCILSVILSEWEGCGLSSQFAGKWDVLLTEMILYAPGMHYACVRRYLQYLYALEIKNEIYPGNISKSTEFKSLLGECCLRAIRLKLEREMRRGKTDRMLSEIKNVAILCTRLAHYKWAKIILESLYKFIIEYHPSLMNSVEIACTSQTPVRHEVKNIDQDDKSPQEG